MSDKEHKTNPSVNAEINESPVPTARHSKAQGEASARTLGICPLNSHNDSHRVDGVSTETGGIVVAMMVRRNHCIGEYAIPYRNAISVNAGLR